MATFRASFMTVDVRGLNLRTMELGRLSSAVRLTDLTTSASSQIVQFGGTDWDAPADGALRMVCDGAVNIAAGDSPSAEAAAGVYLPADTPYDVSIRAGDKLAVIDA